MVDPQPLTLYLVVFMATCKRAKGQLTGLCIHLTPYEYSNCTVLIISATVMGAISLVPRPFHLQRPFLSLWLLYGRSVSGHVPGFGISAGFWLSPAALLINYNSLAPEASVLCAIHCRETALFRATGSLLALPLPFRSTYSCPIATLGSLLSLSLSLCRFGDI